MSARYIAVEGSDTGHYGMRATVIDTHTPRMGYVGKFDWVCQSFSMETAQKIAAALNVAEKAGGDV